MDMFVCLISDSDETTKTYHEKHAEKIDEQSHPSYLVYMFILEF